MSRKFLYRVLFIISILVSNKIYPQSIANINYNEKYKFPLSFGMEYLSLAPVQVLGTDFGGEFQLTDITATVRFPLPAQPVLQPFLQAGMLNVICTDRLELEKLQKFDHNQYYVLAGFGYATKFSKQFELGGEMGVGITQSVFTGLDEDPVGSLNLLVSAGARAALNVSHNISLQLNPTLKFLKTFSPLVRFDGFTFGIGFSGHYRPGLDPDAPQAEIRSIKFTSAAIPPVFAAMQSYYARNPIGSVTIENTETYTIRDVEVAFHQAGYMDTQTQAAGIAELGAGESVVVDLFAIYNQAIFTTEGMTTLTGEIRVDYNARDRLTSQSFSVTYDLYDKEALVWDDDNKVAAFITPADSALRNYTSYVRQVCKDAVSGGFSTEFQTAIQIYFALEEIGCLYQKDPTSPFITAQGDNTVVDAVSLPRNTLQRATGDCDDLTVLYCSLLESVGIETGFITVPGHIYAAFNTGVPAKAYNLLHPDIRMSINVNGALWVPVEITRIGQGDFSEAWRLGIEEFTAFADQPEVRNLYITRKAQEIYRPVALKETDLGLQYGNRGSILSKFTGELEKITLAIVDDYERQAREAQNKVAYNKYGIIAARFAMYPRAEKAFNTALAYDRNYLSPKINLGNLFFQKQEYQNALRILHNAESELQNLSRPSRNYPLVLLNISRSYYELENFDQALNYLARLEEADSELADKFGYLASSDGSARAADLGSFDEVLYAEEE